LEGMPGSPDMVASAADTAVVAVAGTAAAAIADDAPIPRLPVEQVWPAITA
jgi:hypothetical protein